MNESVLIQELAFYGSYHTDERNKIIHIICVPMIWYSAMMFVAFMTMRDEKKWYLNGSTFVFAAYAYYYINLNLSTGLIASLFYLGLYLHLNKQVFDELYAKPQGKKKKNWVLKQVVFFQLFGWWMQVHM